MNRFAISRIFLFAVLLAAQVFSGVVRAEAPLVREVPDCTLACCIPGVCDCGLMPNHSQSKPSPAAPPTQRTEAAKYIPVFVALVAVFQPTVAETPRFLPCGANWIKPHIPPPLRLLCSLLI
ncbi:MAG: hypothetical protein JWO89_1842 [Verrucomicrobiaceae bacterium]|nr:hypothetical protein [Verrucomicrobiaceae bacterium]